jgi:hypothetical protein
MRKLLTLTLASALPALLAAAVLTGCGGSGDTSAGTSDNRAAGDGLGTTTTDRDRDSAADASPADGSGASHPTTTSTVTATADAPPQSGGRTGTTTGTTTPAAPPSTTTTVPGGAASPATRRASTGTDQRYMCPDGGIDAVRALQRSVDAGHQPWRLSAADAAAACTLGLSGTSTEPAGTNRYRVTREATAESVLVQVAQPLGPGTVWAVTGVTPA